MAFTQYLQKKTDRLWQFTPDFHLERIFPSVKATEVKSSPVEGWPDTQHLHFTHGAEHAPGFASHTPPLESTWPSGLPTATHGWRCKDGRMRCFLKNFPLYYQSKKKKNTLILTHCHKNFRHRKLYFRVVIGGWGGWGVFFCLAGLECFVVVLGLGWGCFFPFFFFLLIF